MSDESVRAALRSDARLVVVEAPAGCGKTFQGAAYARELVDGLPIGKPLILTHTHAACSVFSETTKGCSRRVEVRTIDSVIGSIAAAYRTGLGLPADVPAWIRGCKDGNGHSLVAAKVATLLRRHPMIAATVARRHPFVICDEHQDSNADQHAVVMALLKQGARVRIFADPMQKIFRDDADTSSSPAWNWTQVKGVADKFEELDFPHRWRKGCTHLGAWTLTAREALKTGGRIDLRGVLPPSVTIVYAENQSQKYGEYQMLGADRKAVDACERSQDALLVLTHQSQTARRLRSFFNRRILLWEGHTRYGLERLVDTVNTKAGNAGALAAAVVTFLSDVGTGFSPSGFGDLLKQEAQEGCKRNRKLKSATIQELARLLVAEPNHRGIAKLLRQVSELRTSDPAFSDIKIDCHKEFWDAIRLGEFDTTEVGLSEITHRRTYSHPKPTSKAISTIHKAKGLECDAVIVMPCDRKTFPDTPYARCLLYVALSRATRQILLVVSRSDPSPLFAI
jgi:hypothetical protein